MLYKVPVNSVESGDSVQFSKEMLKGYIEIIILSMLYEEDLYGYELAKRVKAKSNGVFELKEGTLYLAFKRLEQSKCIESYWGDEGSGGRRKYYKLLDTGKDVIRSKKVEWEELKKLIDLFLMEVI